MGHCMNARLATCTPGMSVRAAEMQLNLRTSGRQADKACVRLHREQRQRSTSTRSQFRPRERARRYQRFAKKYHTYIGRERPIGEIAGPSSSVRLCCPAIDQRMWRVICVGALDEAGRGRERGRDISACVTTNAKSGRR